LRPEPGQAARRRDAELSALAHELKTPLAVIVGFAELLSARDDEATRLEAAKRITEACERLSGVLDDFFVGVAAEKSDLSRRVLDAVAEGRRARTEERSP
jgi:signal transduction histidine kinase